ncbi:hypothetical protein, partial [Acidithiobacillus thiooxidans]|uniref:hypothetical protein n=1 Tax=Acidithiobacillus thiooxidans TaxID=930 RepID=UPI001A7E1728
HEADLTGRRKSCSQNGDRLFVSDLGCLVSVDFINRWIFSSGFFCVAIFWKYFEVLLPCSLHRPNRS